MGCYVNPDIPKEAWLLLYGEPATVENCGITEEKLPVCLVDNGLFTAAGVAFDENELLAFADDDGRNKLWFMVPRVKLREVSDLKVYE